MSNGTFRGNGGLLAVVKGDIQKVKLSYLPPPVIYPCDGLEIYVNKMLITEPTAVGMDHEVKIIAEEKIIQLPILEVVVTPDKMQAYLRICPQVSLSRQIIDQSPKRELHLTCDELLIVKMPFTEGDLYNYISEQGVVFGIDYDVISDALSVLEPQEFLLAEGLQPTSGVDSVLEEYFGNRVLRHIYQNIAENSANYREHQYIPQVTKNQVLAELKPGLPGKPGKTVTGEQVLPAPVAEYKLVAKQGTEIIDNKVIAVIDGRPFAEGGRYRYYSVARQFVHNEDVSIKTGNLTFSGDLIINGNVFDSMAVTATGNVTVNGSIYNATIKAGQGVSISGNVVGSDIIAANGSETFKVLSEKIAVLFEQVQIVSKKVSAFQDKTGITDTDKLGIVTLHIIEREFPGLEESVNNIKRLLNEKLNNYLEVPEKIGNTVGILSLSLAQLRNCPKCSIKDVVRFMQSTNILADYFKKEQIPRSDILLGNVQNSKIKTSGNVIIRADECFHSEINANRIYARCVVRGGSLVGAEEIFVQEVGSEFGISSILRVPSGKQVRIGLAHENTVVFIGNRMFKIREAKKSVTVHGNI